VDDDGVAVVVEVGDSLSNAQGDLVPGEPISDEIITFVLGMQQIIQVAIGHVLVKQHCALSVAAAPQQPHDVSVPHVSQHLHLRQNASSPADILLLFSPQLLNGYDLAASHFGAVNCSGRSHS